MTTPTRLYLALLLPLLAGSTAWADQEKAREVWQENCTSCHGADGKGRTRTGQRLGILDLTDPARQAAFTDADAAKAIKEGVKDKDGKVTMKPQDKVDEKDIPALIALVRSLAPRSVSGDGPRDPR